jgi:hypothetical protein
MTKISSVGTFLLLVTLPSAASAIDVCNGRRDTDATDTEVLRAMFNENYRLNGDLCAGLRAQEMVNVLSMTNWDGRFDASDTCTFTLSGMGILDPSLSPDPFDGYMAFAGAPLVTNLVFKAIAAGYLFWNGVSFGSGGGPINLGSLRAFHGPADYQALGQHNYTKTWHDWFANYQANSYDNYEALGSFQPMALEDDKIYTYCTLYDASPFNLGAANANTPRRAGTLLHEAWHAVNDEQGTGFKSATNAGHFSGPDGPCTQSACDRFAYHRKVMAEGELYRCGKHDPPPDYPAMMPYQIENEFLCDIADNPAPWVPAAARFIAANMARHTARTHFNNGPGWVCGAAAPVGGNPPTAAGCQPRPTCTSNVDCHAAGFGACVGGCCQCPGASCATTNDCPGGGAGGSFCLSGCCYYMPT